MQNHLHTRNHEKGALGHPPGNMDIPWTQQCIITDVKMYTSLLRLAKELWTHWSSSHKKLQMPQLSSTEKLIMAAKDMTDA
jgi:hypothetical protein